MTVRSSMVPSNWISKAPFTRYNLLSNRSDNPENVCIHNTTSCLTSCQTGLTGSIMYTAGCQTVQPGLTILTTGWTNSCSINTVVKPGLTTRLNEQWLLVQHSCQLIVSCKRGITHTQYWAISSIKLFITVQPNDRTIKQSFITITTNKSTRHRASTSMYLLTFCIRFMLPESHQWKPAVQAAEVMLRTPPVNGQSPASQPRPLPIYTAQFWERPPSPASHQPAARADPAEHSHYVVISLDGCKLVTRVRVMLP